MAAPPVPTGLHPRGGVTVPTNNPRLTVNLQRGTGEDLRVKAHFKLATDAGFTTDVREWTQPDSKFSTGGTHAANIPASLSLFQATWYVTAYAVQETTLLESAPSAAYTFVVDHPIVPVPVDPTGSEVVDVNSGFVRHSWTYTDTNPGSYQTAFQVVVDGGVVDSGKITSPLTYWDEPESAGALDTLLQWNVTLWDEEDIPGPTMDFQLFVTSVGGSISIDTPSDPITAPGPTVSWTYTPVGGRAQVAYEVAVYQLDGLILLFKSGQILGTATSYDLPGTTLKNGVTYSIAVIIKDSGGIYTEFGDNFAVDFTPPATLSTTADESNYETGGYVAVSWTGTPDGDFYAYRVYRKLTSAGAESWLKVSADITDSGESSFDDYGAPSDSALDYVVVQVKLMLGAFIESDKDGEDSVTTVSVPEYWLVDVDPAGIQMHLTQVTEEEFSDETEQEEMLIIGRGRRIEQGTEWGYRGSITAKLYDIAGGDTAREQRLKLQELKRNAGACFLRNPFGDSWRVVPGSISVSRMAGVGVREFVAVTIPYAEVY